MCALKAFYEQAEIVRKKEIQADEEIIFATGNANKMVEVRMILADCGYEIVSMKEAGIDIDIVEDGKTFEENAIIKAISYQQDKGSGRLRGSCRRQWSGS